jgi:hypothetical protein
VHFRDQSFSQFSGSFHSLLAFGGAEFGHHRCVGVRTQTFNSHLSSFFGRIGRAQRDFRCEALVGEARKLLRGMK